MVMKHIKLFENWADELLVPEYLDPNVRSIKRPNSWVTTYAIANPTVIASIKTGDSLNFYSGTEINFKSFSEIDAWKEEYRDLVIYQANCVYKLEDLNGIPRITGWLHLHSTNIKSLKGLENSKMKRLEVSYCYLENLKYCPKLEDDIKIYDIPLLSYYGSTTSTILIGDHNACGKYIRKARGPASFKWNDITSPKVHAELFNLFDSTVTGRTNNVKMKPWELIYNDPNEVENFTFLFIPFWEASEKFRDKAKTKIKNLDMSGFERREDVELW